MEDIIVPTVIFATIFGIFYFYFTTRYRERIALIEKGVDVSIFRKERREYNIYGFFQFLILKIALLFIGIGVGALIGYIIEVNTWYFHNSNPVIYVAPIFICGGTGLLISYFVEKKHKDKIVKNDKKFAELEK